MRDRWNRRGVVTANWVPLSHGQEALWFLAKLVPRTWAYNIVLPAGVRGPLDVAAFRTALQQLSARHPVLRTEFREEGGKPLQRAAGGPLPLDIIDVSNWTSERLSEAIRAEAQTPFELETDAALRTTLFRKSPDQHVLVMVVHHIVSDLWSLIVLMDELRQLYAAAKHGIVCNLPPLQLDYAQYVAQQRAALQSDDGERLWNYWREELAGELPALDLPADHLRPAMQSFRGGTVFHRIDADLHRRFKQFAGKERVTPYMALLAAYEILLRRFTNQESFVVGSPTSGRERAELQG
ncbi:MAG: condensation domain-containing protein, partial [Thermoanaerobaculia bacterium]